MGSSLVDLKKQCRAHFRGLQANFSEDDFRGWNQALAPQLLSALKLVLPRSYVAAYRAFPREASLLPLFGMPFHFCFPKVKPGGMDFRHVAKAKEVSEFEVGAYGILEPKLEHPVVEPREIAAAFIPLVAFDEQGGRMGQGKGYYDRFLAEFKGIRIGVAFEWQRSDTPIPREPHDELLHVVVTEKRVRDLR